MRGALLSGAPVLEDPPEHYWEIRPQFTRGSRRLVRNPCVARVTSLTAGTAVRPLPGESGPFRH